LKKIAPSRGANFVFVGYTYLVKNNDS